MIIVSMFMFYKITNSFPVLNYGKSVAQADLFKFQCVKRVIITKSGNQ